MNETFHGSLSWTLHRYAPYVDLDDNKAFLPHEEGVET